MKITEKIFYYVKHSHDTLAIASHINIEIGQVRPILWNNKGAYCIISRQKVQNIVDNVRDSYNLPRLDTKKEVGIFHWDDGELIDARAAAMLLS